MKTVNFEINIHASKDKVWEKLTNLKSYEEWTGAAFPGSSFLGEWIEGGTIDFFGPDGTGTQVTINKLTENEVVEMTHTALLKENRVPDTESELAKNWIGATDNYYLSENNGITTFKVETSISIEWGKMFSESWPKMLQKLKEISEN